MKVRIPYVSGLIVFAMLSLSILPIISDGPKIKKAKPPVIGAKSKLSGDRISSEPSVGSENLFRNSVSYNQPSLIQSVTAVPDFLWSPNHKMTPIMVNVIAADHCQIASTRIVDIRCNQSATDLNDDSTFPGYLDSSDLSSLRRLSKSNARSSDNRVYTITVEIIDTSGNKARRTTTVVVPKSRAG
jgi:hypothetical protein